MATPKDFFEFVKKNGSEMIDLKFVDLLGSWQHCSFPIDVIDEDTFVEGLGFDGSSIRGWQGIHMSDMLALPDPNTFCMDPFFTKPTVSIIADIVNKFRVQQRLDLPGFIQVFGGKCFFKQPGFILIFFITHQDPAVIKNIFLLFIFFFRLIHRVNKSLDGIDGSLQRWQFFHFKIFI